MRNYIRQGCGLPIKLDAQDSLNVYNSYYVRIHLNSRSFGGRMKDSPLNSASLAIAPVRMFTRLFTFNYPD